jgi:hypothetical protein
MPRDRAARRAVRHGLAAVVAAGVLALPGAVLGQASGGAPTPAQAVEMIRAFLASDVYRENLTTQIRDLEPPVLLALCDKLTPDFDPAKHRITVLSEFTMDSGLRLPVAGSWSSSVPVDRCGSEVRRTILVQAVGKGQFRFAALLPGDTLANAKLQGDTLRAAAPVVAAEMGCKEPVRVIDTVIAEKPVDRAWTETWTFAGCSMTQQRPVRFSPSGQGMDFVVGDPPSGAGAIKTAP